MVRSHFLVSVNIIALQLAAPALAQEAAPSSGATDVFEDIVVTARRSAENIRTVPVTVQAFSGDTLREKSITTTQDLQLSTPGLFANGSGTASNTSYTIRGQGRPLVGVGQSAVVSYMSDVPLPTPASGQPQYDMASVQVLKGPQGTLFGRNTTGGAILFYPQAPTYNFGGYVQLGYGNYDFFGMEGAINVPLVGDKAALRVSGRTANRDGFVRNLGVGRDFHNLDNRSLRVSLLLEPWSGVRNLTTADVYRQTEAGPAQVFSGIIPGSLLDSLASTTRPTLTDVLATQRALGIRTVASPIATFDNITARGISNRTDIDLNGIKFVNIFGYRTVDFANAASYDGLPYIDLFGAGAGPVVKSYRADALDQLTNELQLKGSAFGTRLQWLIGGFYLDSKPGGENIIRVDAFGAAGTPNANFIREKSKAVFGNVSLVLADGLTANAGLRYTWDSISVCTGQATGASEPYAARDEDCRAGRLAQSSITNGRFKRPTWTVGLDWKVNDDVFAYVTSRRGYRAGGVNTPTLGPALAAYQTFEPETITDVEVGTKGKWQAGSVRGLFSASAFYAKAKGVQYNVNNLVTTPGCSPATSFDGDCNPNNDPSGTSITFNAGDTSFTGVEGSFSIKPVRNLTLEVAGSHLHATTDKVTFGSLAPFIAAGGEAANKIPFRFTPKDTVTASARYEVPVGDAGTLVGNVDYYWSGPIVYGAYVGPSYNVVNLRVDWNNVMGRPIDIGLFARNVLNESYVSTAGLAGFSPGTISLVYGDPALYGIQARFRFGS